ncbi:MAG: hypothetical protein LBM65_01810 [Oscillospiraceae bacterium]|jgi:hypothetical protein|nr:hypothetical protein [Oscillospiraceae bacterium]
MIPDIGTEYFISDEFYELVIEPFLRKNYEKTKRPHFYIFKEPNTNLFWMVPCSSKIEKYEAIMQKQIKRRNFVQTIKIVTVNGKKQALVFSDMFPVIDKYIVAPYKVKGRNIAITYPKLLNELSDIASRVVTLLRNGVRFTPTSPDVLHIEKLMLAELEQEE